MTVVVLAVAAGGVGLVAGLQVLEEDAPAAADPATERAGGEAPVAASEPSTVPDDADAETKTADAGPSPTPVSCWDGSTADSQPGCPAGPDDSETAFAWVFDDVDLGLCEPARDNGRRVIRECELGDGVVLNLSRWSSVGPAEVYYGSSGNLAPVDARDGELRWEGVQGRVDLPAYKVAAAYRDHPWSMTVYANDAATAREAFDRYRMRPVARLRSS